MGFAERIQRSARGGEAAEIIRRVARIPERCRSIHDQAALLEKSVRGPSTPRRLMNEEDLKVCAGFATTYIMSYQPLILKGAVFNTLTWSQLLFCPKILGVVKYLSK